MSKYRVSVWRQVETNGWVEVEAEDEQEAYWAVNDMPGEEIEEKAEWGSCGDTDEYGVTDYIEKVYEPSVSDDLWR